jgi:general secretion pathway protein H
MRLDGTSRRTAGGFTLMEMLIVMAVLALVTSLILPAIGAGVRNWELRTAAADLVSNLRLARTEAVTSKLVQAVRVDLDHDRVDRLQATSLAVAAGELEKSAQNLLGAVLGEDPGPVDFAAFGDEDRPATSGAHYILFFPRGNSSGGRVVLKHRDGERTLVVTVAPVTGRVAVDTGKRSDT